MAGKGGFPLVNQLEIMRVIDYFNLNIKKSGRYFRLVDHDSLVIDPQRNSFFWNSRGISGGPARFIKEYFDLNDEELRKKIMEIRHEYVGDGDFQNLVINDKNRARKPFVKTNPLDLKGYLYLSQQRGISREIIEGLKAKDLVASDKRHNIVFLWHNVHGKVVGQDLQGTYINYEKFPKRGTFKFVQESSIPNYGFNISIGERFDHLYVFESPIDLLSYLQMYQAEIKDAKLLSLNGAATKVATINTFLKDQSPTDGQGKLLLPKCIHLAPDNDNAGRELIAKFETLRLKRMEGYSLNIVEWCKYKDWNEQLLSDFKANIKNKKEKLSMDLNTFDSFKIYQKLREIK